MRRLLVLILFSAAAFAAVPAPGGSPAYPVPDGLPEGWYAHMDTSMGRILVLLLPEQSPQAVAHFAALANGEMEWSDPITGERLKQPYYDGALVTRAKGGLMFEAGDKSGTGGFAPAIFVPLEGAEPVNFSLGHRVGLKKLGGGQVSATRFFITASAQPFLTGEHSCIGVVVEGQSNVFEITAVKTRPSGDPIEDVVFHQIRVFRVGNPAPLPEPIPYFPPPMMKKMERSDPSSDPPGDGGRTQAP